MLSRFIVSSYRMFVEIALWLFLIGSIIVGYTSIGGFLGIIAGLLGGFVISVMFFGAFLVILEIQKSVDAIEKRQEL